MEPITKLYCWNSLKGSYPWCVGVCQDRVLARLRTPELAKDYATKLRGEEIHGFVESDLNESSRKVATNAKIIFEKPSS